VKGRAFEWWKVETAKTKLERKHTFSTPLPYRLLSSTPTYITTHTWPQQQKQRKIRKRHCAHVSTAPHGLSFSPNSLLNAQPEP